MAADSRKRQKKKERRTQKRNDKKRGLVRRQSVPLIERLQAAVDQPILHCRITESLWSEGLGMVLLSRELPGGRIAAPT